MPLKMTLKAGEKIIVNGAVLENAGSEAHLLFLNEAVFMREKDILAETDSLTPASRIYFTVQCLYVFPERREYYSVLLSELMSDYLEAAPSALPIIERVQKQVEQGEFYYALKSLRALIAHEKERLDDVSSSIESVPDPASNGESSPNHGLGTSSGGKTSR